MNKLFVLYEERGDLLERKAISQKYNTGWYLQAQLDEVNEQIRVIENVTPQAQKTYFEILAEPTIEVEPWNVIPDWRTEAEAQAADAADWQATQESDYPR